MIRPAMFWSAQEAAPRCWLKRCMFYVYSHVKSNWKCLKQEQCIYSLLEMVLKLCLCMLVQLPKWRQMYFQSETIIFQLVHSFPLCALKSTIRLQCHIFRWAKFIQKLVALSSGAVQKLGVHKLSRWAPNNRIGILIAWTLHPCTVSGLRNDRGV